MKTVAGNVDVAVSFLDLEMDSEFGAKHKSGDASNDTLSTDISDEEG